MASPHGVSRLSGEGAVVGEVGAGRREKVSGYAG